MKSASDIALSARDDVIAEKLINLQEYVAEARRAVKSRRKQVADSEVNLVKCQGVLAQFIKDVDEGREFPVTDFVPQQ